MIEQRASEKLVGGNRVKLGSVSASSARPQKLLFWQSPRIDHYSNRTCVWPRSACVYCTTDRKFLAAYGLKTCHSVSDSEKSKSSNE